MHRRSERSLLGETLGTYHVKDRLGQGGMGAVYLAKDTALDRLVALKVLLPRYADDDEFISRFQREARASAKLNHPNIVQIYAVDVESDPPYMAMEYIEGQNLESFIRGKKRLSWQQALNFVAQVASALDCAHKAGIVHRDIKPANVLVDKNGRARVTDFGIAKILGSQTNLTGTQHTVGSPCYMSPEQCGVGEVGPASDLFSLGVMLYEMVVGTVPFKGDSSIVVMRKIADEDIPPLSKKVADIPPEVDQILETLTARDLKLRYTSAVEVLDDLRAYKSGGTMAHLQSRRLEKAAHGPASASAADLTRSPTGTGVALSDSLVASLIDETRPLVKHVPQRREIDIPWKGIGLTLAFVAVVALAMIYYDNWVKNQPPRQPAQQRQQTDPPPRPEDGAQAPPDGWRPPPPPDGRRLPPPRDGGAGDGFRPPPPREGGPRPRDGQPPPQNGFPPPQGGNPPRTQ